MNQLGDFKQYGDCGIRVNPNWMAARLLIDFPPERCPRRFHYWGARWSLCFRRGRKHSVVRNFFYDNGGPAARRHTGIYKN